MKKYLGFDDIELLPKYSDITDGQFNLSTKITKNVSLDIPIISLISTEPMFVQLDKLGGVGILSDEFDIIRRLQILFAINELRPEMKIGASIKLKEDYWELAKSLTHYGADFIHIDINNGHHKLVKDGIRRLKDEGEIDVLVGNICTPEATKDVCDWGADGIQLGSTSVGLPMVTTLLDCVPIADDYNVPCNVGVGIRNYSDVCKGLACGADTVTLDSMLSETRETLVECKVGSTENIIEDVKYHILSSMKLVGSRDLSTFHSNSELIKI
tara:strand:+ start:721 stop:1530 length:810 start_codon:yes stop_codon:yes gene_type:complete